MHRLIARLLLVLIVVSATAPMLEALSADPPHACCLRKAHGASEHDRDPRLHDVRPHRGNCCPPMTAPLSAGLSKTQSPIFFPPSSEFDLIRVDLQHATGFDTHHSSRAPPAFS